MDQENVKKRGRPALENKSISVHCRVQYDLYRLLINEQERQEIQNGHKPALSAVLMGAAKKNFI